jgi:ribosomal protein S18 acetylase RimI-like enzyme
MNATVMNKMKRIIKQIIRLLIYEHNEAYWYQRSLSGLIPEVNINLPIDISLHNANETVDWLKSFAEPWMYNKKEIQIGLMEKHYIANAKLDGAIIAYSKVGHNRVYVDDYSMVVNLPKGVALLYHVYVLREHRKNNIAKYLVSKLLAELKENDFSSMCCQIAIWNKPSISLFSSLELKEIAHVKYYKLFGVLRFWRIKKEDERRFTLSTHFSYLSL